MDMKRKIASVPQPSDNRTSPVANPVASDRPASVVDSAATTHAVDIHDSLNRAIRRGTLHEESARRPIGTTWATQERQEKPELQRFSVLVAFLIAMMPLPATAGETLTQKQISQQIIGKELTATRNGVNMRLKYLPDGNVTLKVLLLSYSGVWDFDGDSICMNMTGGPRKGRNCVTFTPLGGNKFLNSEGVTMTASE